MNIRIRSQNFAPEKRYFGPPPWPHPEQLRGGPLGPWDPPVHAPADYPFSKSDLTFVKLKQVDDANKCKNRSLPR